MFDVCFHISHQCLQKRRQELLSAATRKHRLITKLAMQGKGVDRHLIGLKLAAVTSNRDIPEVFKDPAYTQPYRFSTSQTPLIQEFTEYLDYPDKVRPNTQTFDDIRYTNDFRFWHRSAALVACSVLLRSQVLDAVIML